MPLRILRRYRFTRVLKRHDLCTSEDDAVAQGLRCADSDLQQPWAQTVRAMH